mmetsp:Transcript_2204/g.6645  ORF Transcript_2204/g.6645 Transcript_2204/m.6645 type:complete len:112 (+) Transcript_2204:261-596(+)
MFEQFRSILRREFPHARFDGAIMSPGQVMEALSQMLSMGFLVTVVSLFAGDYVLPAAMAALLSENKGSAFFAAMGMNMVAGKLISTGAFEVLANGIPIHSKVCGKRVAVQQ